MRPEAAGAPSCRERAGWRACYSALHMGVKPLLFPVLFPTRGIKRCPGQTRSLSLGREGASKEASGPLSTWGRVTELGAPGGV